MIERNKVGSASKNKQFLSDGVVSTKANRKPKEYMWNAVDIKYPDIAAAAQSE